MAIASNTDEGSGIGPSKVLHRLSSPEGALLWLPGKYAMIELPDDGHQRNGQNFMHIQSLAWIELTFAVASWQACDE